MNRAIRILLILLIGGLVLWETLSWGTRVWTKYKIIKEPLPSITSLIPSSAIQPLIALTLVLMLIFTTISTILRSRKLFGLIPLNALSRHVVLLGPTGSGKTTVAKAIIAKTLAKTPATVIVLDWKGEYIDFLPNASVVRKINIWDVPGESAREKALLAVELLREIFRDVVEIGPPSALLLLKNLEEEYKRGVPTTEKVLKVLEKHAEIAQREFRHAEANMYLALMRRLYLLLVDEERQAKNEEGDPRVIVYDLGGLPSVYLKTLYSGYVLASVYREAMKAGMSEGLKTLLIAEEAQNYIHQRRASELPSMAERIVYELRGFGVGVILVCPDPELLPTAVLKDVGAVISTSPDTFPRFVLERFLFRASLEEGERTLKELKRAKLIIYHRGNLHYLRRLPKPSKELRLKTIARPKGDRMGVIDPGVGSLRAWPILPHRSPGRPTVEAKEEVKEEVKKPKVIEVITEPTTESKPKVLETVEELRLEPEEEEVVETEEVVEKEVTEQAIEEKLSEEMPPEPEPAPKGPPIPSSLPYRGSLCPAGRPHLTPVH